MTKKKRWPEYILYPARHVKKEKLLQNIQGKTILITGASFGIGEKAAYKLACRGVTLLLVARTEEKLLRIKSELELNGATVHIFTADLRQQEQVNALIEYIRNSNLKINIFISNAGKSICRPVFESLNRFHDFERTMAINYYAPVQLTLALIPALKENKGQIINISAINVLFAPTVYWAAYQASKTAMDSWFRCVLPELKVHGVMVSSVYLPLVRTRMIEPTKAYENTPAMMPEEAADVICCTIIKRSRKYAPWWSFFPQLLSLLFRRQWEFFMTQYLKKLINLKIISLKGIFTFLRGLIQAGVNAFVLAETGSKLFGNETALHFEGQTYTYNQVKQLSVNLAKNLKLKYDLHPGQKIAIAAANQPELIFSIFAAARLGMDLYMLNMEMSEPQLKQIIEKNNFDFIIYDANIEHYIVNSDYENKSCSISSLNTCESPETVSFRKTNFNKISVLTSGSTGSHKNVSRKTSSTDFIPPFVSLINRLKLYRYRSVYLGTPVYHGFGLVTMFVSFAMGAKIFMSRTFDKVKVCELINQYKIECITIVPLMLSRMLAFDAAALKSLHCIICGGAALSPVLVEDTKRQLGSVLYNLYGSSEAGFSMMATPVDLNYSAATIGKPLWKVKAKIMNGTQEAVCGKTGILTIKCNWSVNKKEWISTGDLAYVDENGYYFLQGRADDMIVSGGENVYPCEIEQVLRSHTDIKDVIVIGVDDSEFGQRLAAFIVPDKGYLSEEDIRAWLLPKVARFQMPKTVMLIPEIPFNALGKPDKKALAEIYNRTKSV